MGIPDYIKTACGAGHKDFTSSGLVLDGAVQRRLDISGVNGHLTLGKPCFLSYQILRRAGNIVLLYEERILGVWSSEGVVVNGDVLTCASPSWPGGAAEAKFISNAPCDIFSHQHG